MLITLFVHLEKFTYLCIMNKLNKEMLESMLKETGLNKDGFIIHEGVGKFALAKLSDGAVWVKTDFMKATELNQFMRGIIFSQKLFQMNYYFQVTFTREGTEFTDLFEGNTPNMALINAIRSNPKCKDFKVGDDIFNTLGQQIGTLK